jgi:hypothetical protein
MGGYGVVCERLKKIPQKKITPFLKRGGSFFRVGTPGKKNSKKIFCAI